MARRNLCHNEANHQALLGVGAVDVLATMMRPPSSPAQRINAAMAVAILVRMIPCAHRAWSHA